MDGAKDNRDLLDITALLQRIRQRDADAESDLRPVTAEKWMQLKKIFEAAQSRPPPERVEVVRAMAEGDQELELAVRELLAAGEDAGSFLQTPAAGLHNPVLAPGTRLGPYQILGLLGEGGMGKIYRGLDTRLGRAVAIKISAAQFSKRFEQEARAISALNHPNICTLYDVGPNYLVTELVEGETLRDWLRRAPSMERRLETARQVLEALRAAHCAGIVHRDLKPQNIMVRFDGYVKVLDFGLAKQMPAARSVRRESVALPDPSLPGQILGTVAYMSPEQIQGHPVDQRSDLFAFGTILFEMLTGQHPWPRRSAVDTLHAILHDDPAPMSAAGISANLASIVRKLLAKSPAERYPFAEAVLEDLSNCTTRQGSSAATVADRKAASRGSAEEVQFVPEEELNIVAASHSSVQAQVKETKPWGWITAAAIVLVAAVFGAFKLFVHRPRVLTGKDTVVLADFANSTGDPVFDGTLRQGLAIQLKQSPFLSLISDQRIQQTLPLMGQPPDTRLTPELARDICIRTGSAATLDGSIASLGSKYVLGMRARNCRSGDVLDEEQVEAAKKEDVLSALTDIATKFRTRVGESLSSIREHDTPLSEATTSSLGALKAFTLGEVRQIRNVEDLDAVPFYLHAIELDPNFAIAYARLGTIYSDLGQSETSRQYREKAFQLKDHTSEHERLYIVAHYYGDNFQFDKGMEAWELYRQTYPRDAIPLKNLAVGHNLLGEFDKGLENAQEAIRVDPDTGAQYILAAWACLGLHRAEEAKAILNTALQRKVGGYGIHMMLAQVALQQHDEPALTREEALLKTSTLAGISRLYFAAMLAASRGQLRRSEELASQAQETSLRLQLKEPAARWLAAQARLEAEIGLRTRAIENAHSALSLDTSPRVVAIAGLALAMARRDEEAQSLIIQLEKRYPDDQFAQFVEVPRIRAALALNHEDAIAAITYLERAKPLDRANPSTRLERARALLRGRRLKDAASEFEAVAGFPYGASVDAGGPLWTCFTVNLFAPLANLGLARSRGLAGDISGSRRAYQEFFVAWRDADPDIPILQQAKEEYARLK